MRSRPKPSRTSRENQRGVTLMELMAVLVIVGIFVAMAGPSMGSAARDRRSVQAADTIATMFRLARSRAAATGAAHLVLTNVPNLATVPASGLPTLTDNWTARFELRAAMQTTGAPVASCTTRPGGAAMQWNASDSYQVQLFDTSADTQTWAHISIGVLPQINGATVPAATQRDFCYTPSGQLFWRGTGSGGTGGAWGRPSGFGYGWAIARFDDTGAKTLGVTRSIAINMQGVPWTVSQ